MSKFKRIVIYPKDISLITGKSERQARTILKTIKKEYRKKPYQLVTVWEVSEYLGIGISELEEIIY